MVKTLNPKNMQEALNHPHLYNETLAKTRKENLANKETKRKNGN
jgi:hypothetical protein